jgi:hypothetical protein
MGILGQSYRTFTQNWVSFKLPHYLVPKTFTFLTPHSYTLKLELHFSGWSDHNVVLSDPLVLCMFYLLKYFHNFTEFIEDIIAYLNNQ